MNEQEIEMLMLFLKALADKTRLRIMGLIAEQERSVEEIASLLDLKPPTVSHHLNKLKECGLVSMRANGTVHLYSLNEARLSALLRDLSPKVFKEVAEDMDTSAFDRKVLESFIVDGHLVEIPAQRKKRDVILRRLIEEFDVGRQYSEKEVNETLKRFHEDTATIRREFIGGRMMARENSVYWRING
jgi:predicted transcriptional regulator